MKSLKNKIKSKWNQRKSIVTGLVCLSLVPMVSAKTLIDYFLPMPIVKPLKTDVWGAKEVGRRDIGNGIEDTTGRKYSYWDGPIIKGPDGKYHMFPSRWDAAGGHWAWLSSLGAHAVSDSVMGPYIDKGLTWPGNSGGKGHNMTILELKDKTYACVVSDTRPGDFFTAPTLDGPWTFAGKIQINANGFQVPQIANLSIIIRPDDGKFMIVARNGQIMISSNLVGPYVIQGNSIYNSLVNAPNLEDPVLWYSGGLYHIVVNSWSDKKAYHLTSKDGITKWSNQGLAFDPKSNFLRYTDGTVNHWCKIERPGVFIQNGHITHWTFAVINVEKDKDVNNNDNNNSKVIVVPFDGAAFDGVTDVAKPQNSQKILDEKVHISYVKNSAVSINVPYNSAYEMRIMQPDGKIIKTLRDNKEKIYTFSRNDLNSGVYIVNIISGSNKVSKTMVIN